MREVSFEYSFQFEVSTLCCTLSKFRDWPCVNFFTPSIKELKKVSFLTHFYFLIIFDTEATKDTTPGNLVSFDSFMLGILNSLYIDPGASSLDELTYLNGRDKILNSSGQLLCHLYCT